MLRTYTRQLVKRIKPLEYAAQLIKNLGKRNLTYVTCSPRKTFVRAQRFNLPTDDIIWPKLTHLIKPVAEHVSVQSVVTACPLKNGNTNRFSGGLVHTESRMLIDSAVHSDGTLCQELTEENIHQMDSAMPELRQPVFFGGIMLNNFGHFLLECIGRLWAYEYVKELQPPLLFFAPHGQPKYLEKRNFVFQILEGLRIPHKKIAFISTPTRLRHVIIPAQKYGYELCKSCDHLMLNFLEGFQLREKIPARYKAAKKIYVSRSKLPAGAGKPLGEEQFEQFLVDNQYTIFHPELHSLHEQLHVYKNASKIIFCDGGAIHACILLPGLAADVAIVARRRDHRWDWGTTFRDQFEGFGKTVLWIDEEKAQYQFGRETWHATGLVDWHKVSLRLLHHNFVKQIFRRPQDFETYDLVKRHLPDYIKASLSDPDFIKYMADLRDVYDSDKVVSI